MLLKMAQPMRDAKARPEEPPARRSRNAARTGALDIPLGYALPPRPADAPGVAAVAARTQAAIGRLTARADRSSSDAAFVVALLDAVFRAAEDRVAPAPMPSPEQRVWESVGARFDDLDAPARAGARGITAYADLLARSVSGDAEMAKVLGVDTSRISQRVRERSLFFVTEDDVRFYPLWQLGIRGDATVPGLKAVLRELDARLHPIVVDHWFTTPSNELQIGDENVSPADWLRTGGPSAPVANLASLL